MPLARILLSSLCLFSLLPSLARAAEVAAPSLTPMGAELGGNADGSIPAWAGDNGGPANRSTPAQQVSRDNVDAYLTLLSPGQRALLEALPDSFRMPVYGARRGYAPPAAFAADTAANAGRARLGDDGTISGLAAGLPFPGLGDSRGGGLSSNASAGLAAIWNHRLRWRGIGRERRYQQVAVSTEGVLTPLSVREDSRFLRGLDADRDKAAPLLLQQLFGIITPARLAGAVKLSHERIDGSISAWQRSPIDGAGGESFNATSEAGGDTPVIGSDGLYTEDQREGYAGDPTRWRWTLIGKRDLLVPYHADNLHARGRPLGSVLGARHPDSSVLRYERHRVWQLEARLNPDDTGIWPRRTYYLDEDSWQVLLVEHYNRDDRVERLQEVHVRLAGDVLLPAVEVIYDLPGRRYFVTGLETEADATVFRAQDADQYDVGRARRWAKAVGAVPAK